MHAYSSKAFQGYQGKGPWGWGAMALETLTK